jgi:hypothetical protein
MTKKKLLSIIALIAESDNLYRFVLGVLDHKHLTTKQLKELKGIIGDCIEGKKHDKKSF